MSKSNECAPRLSYDEHENLVQTLCKMSDDNYSDVIVDTARSHDLPQLTSMHVCMFGQTIEDQARMLEAVRIGVGVHNDALYADNGNRKLSIPNSKEEHEAHDATVNLLDTLLRRYDYKAVVSLLACAIDRRSDEDKVMIRTLMHDLEEEIERE